MVLIMPRRTRTPEEIARNRLERELGNSGIIAGAVFSGIATFVMLTIALTRYEISIKIIIGIIAILLLGLTIYLGMNYLKQKNAMEDILEAFLSGERSISNISIISGLNSKAVMKIIQSMIIKGIIQNAYIDKLNYKIVEKQKTTDNANNIGKVVKCTGCGAKNTLKGIVDQKCEYCGAVLSEE